MKIYNKIFFNIIILILLIFNNSNSIATESCQIPSEINITIKGSQYKDLLKQYILLIKNEKNGLLNPKNIKKSVRSELTWIDPSNNKINKDLAKVRFTGDYWPDHINLRENTYSLQVSLNTKNIDGVISTFRPPIFWKDKETVKQQIKGWRHFLQQEVFGERCCLQCFHLYPEEKGL